MLTGKLVGDPPVSPSVTPYFIELDEADIADQAIRAYINKIPTSFSLQKEQVDILIDMVKKVLRQDLEYQKLLRELGVTSSALPVNRLSAYTRSEMLSRTYSYDPVCLFSTTL